MGHAMIEKQIRFSQLEVTESGAIQVRLEKQLVENGKVLAREYHRTVIEPGTDTDAQMAAVNAHLGAMGYPPAEAEAVERVKRIVAVEHTPERVQKFRDERARLEAELRGQKSPK